jgi:hypothetical protein
MQTSSARSKKEQKLEDLETLKILFPRFLPYKVGKPFG